MLVDRIDEIEQRVRELETEFAYWRGTYYGIDKRDNALREWAPVIIAIASIAVTTLLSWIGNVP